MEYVNTSARAWKSGIIRQGAKPHAACRNCGGDIWFGQVQFKGKSKPSWIAYSEAGHGGGGEMVMVKHECTNPAHSSTKTFTPKVP